MFAFAQGDNPSERECPVCHVVNEWEFVDSPELFIADKGYL